MARSVSATLEAAQIASNRKPYIYMLFTSADGNTTYDYSIDLQSRRILAIDHYEEPYNDYAVVVLRNNDRTIPDLMGYWVEIGYGYVTGAGNEHSQTAHLWVEHQQVVSAGGRLYTVLELEGMWAKLMETLLRVGDPPFYTNTYSTNTIYDIIAVVLAEAGMTLDALVEDDGIIDTFIPTFDVNQVPFEDGRALIYRLISDTKSYLRPEQGLAFEVVYPDEYDANDEEYVSDAAYYFYSYMSRDNLLIPNHIYVFCNQDADGTWTAANMITGEALDQDEIDRYGEVIGIDIAASIDNQDDADSRAEALLYRAKAEASSGKLIVNHDCRVELYDRIGVTDNR